MSVSSLKCYEQGEIWSIFWSKTITQIRLREVYSLHKAEQQAVELNLATTQISAKPYCLFLPHLFQQELPLFGSPRGYNSLKDTILVKHCGFIFWNYRSFSLYQFLVNIVIFSLKLKLPNSIYGTIDVIAQQQCDYWRNMELFFVTGCKRQSMNTKHSSE